MVHALVMVLLVIFLPFVAVYLQKGLNNDFLINVILIIFLWIPGIIHAYSLVGEAMATEMDIFFLFFSSRIMYSQDETLYVVDSAPFINQELNIFAKNIITIKEVLNEIKDKKAREFILNHDIKTQIPSEESIKHIIQFAKKTGDFASLSLTDIKVLALTLQLEWEIKGRDHLRKDPVGVLKC
jgi:uncharacterized membrane protein YqaE (UPF0057 family)